MTQMSRMGLLISLCHGFVRGVQIDAGGAEALVANLPLNNRQGKLVNVDMDHEVGMSKRVRGQPVEASPLAVLAVLMVQASLFGVAPENLTQSIRGVVLPGTPRRREEKQVRVSNPLVPLVHPAYLPEKTHYLVHQAPGQVARPPPARFRVLSREEYDTSAKVQMLELDSDELTHPAAKLVDHPEHQLVPVVLNTVEESLQFIHGEISYGLAKSLVFRARFHI